MNCIHCGAQVPAHAKFCPKCGKFPKEEVQTGIDAQEENEIDEGDVVSGGDEPFDAGEDLSEQNVSDEVVEVDDTSEESVADEIPEENDISAEPDAEVAEDEDFSKKDDSAQDADLALEGDEDQQSESSSVEPDQADQTESLEQIDESEQPEEGEPQQQGEQDEQLEQSAQPEQDGQPESSEQPAQDEQSEQPAQDEQSEQPEQPEQSAQDEQPEQPEQDEQLDPTEQLEQSEQPEEGEPPARAEEGEQPEQPAQDEQPKQPERPEQATLEKLSHQSRVNAGAVVFAVIIVILLAAAVVGVVWYVVTTNPASNTEEEETAPVEQEEDVNVGSESFGHVLGEALYGSSEQVTVSADTFIMPQDISGNPLEAYTVRAMARSDPDENADRTRYVSDLQTESGFMLSQVFNDLPEGLYSIVIATPDGEDYVLPIVNYVAYKDLSNTDDEAPIELAIRPPTSEENKSEKAQQACTLYYAKCLDYEERYGSRSNVSIYLNIVGESEEPLEIAPLLGFCSAHSVDFNNDGLDELVVVYYSEDASVDESDSEQNASQDDASHYIIEVWEYDKGSINRIYQGAPFVESSMAQVVAAIISWEDQMYLLGGIYTDEGLNLLLYGYTPDELKLEHAIYVSPDQQSAVLDGQSIEGWPSVADQMSLIWSEDMVYVASDSASSFYKTLRDIRRIAGVVPASINDDATSDYYGGSSADNSSGNDINGSSQDITGSGSEVLFEDNESDYILPDESTRNYDRSELEALSDYELFLARNEIFARHGRGFDDDSLQEYFDSKSWYEQQYTADEFDAMESPLNEYEKANSDLIEEVERERGSSYL